jgi:predicted nucleic acid-binding protein
MVTSADTSILFSLYANDAHTSRLLAWLAAHPAAITVTPLAEFELHNALRFAEFRGALAAGDAVTFWRQFEEDRESGRIVRRVCNLATVLDEATRLSAAHTISHGHRSFDILHVAAARVMDAEQFLTFDANQQQLAAAEGLALPL